jgi:hypothetical protein
MNMLSMGEMALKLAQAEVGIHIAAREGLERVARKVEATAKAEIGVYQDGIGPFGAWPALAESTQEERSRLGYSPNDPLLRDGTLRDSIGHEVAELEAVIGSTSDIMFYQEFGTARIPPRPVLGPAAERNHEAILEILGGAVVEGLIGGSIIHHSLGYSSTVED